MKIKKVMVFKINDIWLLLFYKYSNCSQYSYKLIQQSIGLCN